jgi:hypothetical protein
MSTSPAALLVRIEADDVAQAVAVGAFNALWDPEIALNANGQRCKVETAYQFASGAIAQPDYRLPLTISLSANGSVRHIVTHANNQLRPNEPGYLRLVIHCPTASTVEWRGTKLLESKHAWQASQHHRQ